MAVNPMGAANNCKKYAVFSFSSLWHFKSYPLTLKLTAMQSAQ
jgi:hypothetical protein